MKYVAGHEQMRISQQVPSFRVDLGPVIKIAQGSLIRIVKRDFILYLAFCFSWVTSPWATIATIWLYLGYIIIFINNHVSMWGLDYFRYNCNIFFSCYYRKCSAVTIIFYELYKSGCENSFKNTFWRIVNFCMYLTNNILWSDQKRATFQINNWN